LVFHIPGFWGRNTVAKFDLLFLMKARVYVNDTINIKEQVEILVKLQAIDSDKKKIDAMLSKVDKKIRTLDADLNAYRSIVKNSENELEELRKKYRDLESELSMNNPRIESSKEKLRAVKTNKEYQSLLKEIEELKKINSSLEDSILECLEQIEQSESSIKESEAEFTAIEERVGQEKLEVSRDADKAEQKLQELNKERAKVADKVAPEMLNTFEKVRGKSRGMTIAPVIDAVCQACNMNIPPQMYNELQRFKALTFCPSCQRIIYWKSAEAV